MVNPTRPYSVTINDVSTGRDVISAAVDLTEDQKRALVAYVLGLTDVPADRSGTLVDEFAPRGPKVDLVSDLRSNWNWPGRITAALSDGYIGMATKHYHSFADAAPNEASRFLGELQAGQIDFAVLLAFKMAVARGPKG